MKKLLILLLLPLNILGQNYDMYRVVTYSNDSVEIVSMSNTILVPQARMLFVPYFQVMGKGLDGLTIEIYNRWGQMVFEAPHLNERWDGTYRGVSCPIGTYVYQLKLNNKIVQSGTVTLVK